MYLSFYKTIISIVALGCFLPIFALTEVIMADGSVVSGEIISEEVDKIVINVDGSNVSIARTMIQEIRSDENQLSPSVPSASTLENSAYNPGNDQTTLPVSSNTAAVTQASVNTSYSDEESQKQEHQNFGRTEPEHVTIGADAYWSLLAKSRNSNGGDITGDTIRNTLMINPYVGIHTSEIFEIRPSLYISRTRTSYNWEDNSGLLNVNSSTTYSSQWGLGAGVGFLFHTIHGSFFRFVLGPEIGFNIFLPPKYEREYGSSETIKTEYDRYVDIDIPLSVPFSLDFVVSNHLGFRLSSEVLSFTLNINSVDMSGESTVDYTDVGLSSSLDLMKTITQLGIGVFLLF